MTATIATAHSINMQREKGKSITVELQGGNPWFVYLWINNELHALTTRGKSFRVRRVKSST